MSYAEASAAAIVPTYRVMGSDATFRPQAGPDVACRVIIDYVAEWEPSGQIRYAEGQTTVHYRRSQIDRKLKRGEQFLINAVVWLVVSMAHYPDSWTDLEGVAVVQAL